MSDWREFLTDPTWTLAVTVGECWAALAVAFAAGFLCGRRR